MLTLPLQDEELPLLLIDHISKKDNPLMLVVAPGTADHQLLSYKGVKAVTSTVHILGRIPKQLALLISTFLITKSRFKG